MLFIAPEWRGSASNDQSGWVRFLSLLFRNDEFQSGPDSVDRTDLDIDEAKGKRGIAHHYVRQVGREPCGFFGHDTKIARSGATTTR